MWFCVDMVRNNNEENPEVIRSVEQIIKQEHLVKVAH